MIDFKFVIRHVINWLLRPIRSFWNQGIVRAALEHHTMKTPVLQIVDGLKPPQGQTWNPLLKLPRNHWCPCGSGKKFKHCHLETMPRCIPIELAEDFKQVMNSGAEIDFVSDDNKPYGIIR